MPDKKKRGATTETVLKLKVRGPAIRSGRIAIPDLIRICQEAQNALNRQAEAMEGRKTVHPGPVSDVIRKGCTLDLVRIRKGTTTLIFSPAEPKLPFPDRTSLVSEAVEEIAKTMKHFSNGKAKDFEIDEGVLQGIYSLGGIADGRRVSEIVWISPKIGRHKHIAVKVNKVLHERVAKRLSSPRKRRTQVDGVLDMADFKPSDLKCRIDPAYGAPVLCTFEERDASQIQLLLREPVRAIGEGTFQPYTDRLDSLHIDSIERLPSLSLGEGNFYAESSLAELAASQRVKPLKTGVELRGGFPDDEDIDEFLDEIYKSRK